MISHNDQIIKPIMAAEMLFFIRCWAGFGSSGRGLVIHLAV